MKKTLITFLLSAGAAFCAPIVYQVSVTTGAGVSGTNGSLDFTYAPGPTATQASTATVSAFSPTATLGVPSITGSPTGSLATSLVIANTAAYNDYFLTYTFPTTISFTLTFSGPAVDSPNPGSFTSGSTFGFSLYDPTGTTPIDSSNAAGFLFTVDLSNAGVTKVSSFSNRPTLVSVTPLTTPEPASMAMMFAGLAGLVLARRRLASK